MKAKTKLTIMIKSGDEARADIAMSDGRVYYRFATDDTIEDGDLPLKEDFANLSGEILDALTPREGEHEPGEDLTLKIFIDNMLTACKYSEQSLARAVYRLTDLAEEFIFLKGFCQ